MGKLRDVRRVGSGMKAAHVLFVSASLLIVLGGGNLHAADKLPQVKLSVKPLDLSGPVSREALMSAGQLGGQLYPTHEIPDKKKDSEINKSFGKAIEAWNRHEYKKAIGLFCKHIGAYPDSPWEAEAALHIGCDAQYTGRFNEAEECFTSIRKKYAGKEHDGAKRLVNKATLRLAVLKVSQNNYDEAGKLFTALHKTGSDWRERTYASHWI